MNEVEKESGKRCNSCEHWKATTESAVMGVCRRFPPTPFLAPDTGKISSFYPPVGAVDRCGEYRPLRGAK